MGRQGKEWCGQYSGWGLLLLLGIFFFVLNFWLPLFSDDYAYAFIWDGTNGGNLLARPGALERVSSFGDIFVSQWSHYFTWGGRVVAHTLVQFFLWQGKGLFNVCNTLIFLLTIVLIIWLGTGRLYRRPLPLKYVAWVFACLWLCNLAFADTCLWLTAACNYLWMGSLQLLFLLPYSQAYFGNPAGKLEQYPILGRVGMLLLGILAGWTNENAGLVTISAAAMLSWRIRSEGRLKRWMLLGLGGAALGYALMMAAPGNFARAAILAGIVGGQGKETFLSHLQRGIFLLAFELPMLLPITPLLRKSVRQRVAERGLSYLGIFAGLSFFNLVMMLFSPVFPVRAGYASIVFLCIASVNALHMGGELSQESFWAPSFKRLLCVFGVTACLVTMGASLYGNLLTWQQTKARHAMLVEHPGEAVTVAAYQMPSWLGRLLIGHTGVSELSTDPDAWLNQLFARYYGLKSIRINEK